MPHNTAEKERSQLFVALVTNVGKLPKHHDREIYFHLSPFSSPLKLSLREKEITLYPYHGLK